MFFVDVSLKNGKIVLTVFKAFQIYDDFVSFLFDHNCFLMHIFKFL